MTDKEKLDRMKKLADAMYTTVQYLTTDASRLRKAMEDYHKFIIYEYHKQEPASEDFEAEWKRYCDSKGGGAVTMNVKDVAKHFAQWQRKQMIKELKPDFSGMIIHNYLKDCWQFCDGEIPTYKCINPDYINVEVFITSKK